jgi:AraC-like DNA-binding protein
MWLQIVPSFSSLKGMALHFETPPSASRPRAATPIAFVRAVVLAYERYGQDPSLALQAAQIAPQLLDDSQACITSSQMEILCDAAMRELDDEALGWFSRKLPWGSYGLLCRASLGSTTLGVAIKRWCRHHRLMTDDLALTLTIEGADAVVSIGERENFEAFREFCLVSSLRYLHGYACWVIDSRISLREVTFPFSRPLHGQVYPLIFPGPIIFDAPQAGFRFDARYLDLALRRNESALRTMLHRALPLTVLQYRHDRLLLQGVRTLLRMRPGEMRNAESLATELGLSVRSLHRQLHQEGASVQQLRDEVRCEYALELLHRTARPVKQVAQAVGFLNEKSFSRAFKSWTGRSPSEVRGDGET